jgi:hypothetical protein
VSQSRGVLENSAGPSSRQSWLRFALPWLFAGFLVGGVCAGMEYLLHGRNLRDVALPTYLVVFPLVGLGLGRLAYRYPLAWGPARPRNFFSVGPLPPEQAAARGRQIRRSMWIGFGTGIAVALVAIAVDFAWRGWPFLALTLFSSLLLYPYFGTLLGYNISLRPGDSRPSIRDFRFRMRTLMILVAYFGILFGFGSVASRYSRLASQYHANCLNARTMVDLFQGLLEKERANLKRGENAKELRAGRIPPGLLPAQQAFLKGLEGNSTEQYKIYRYGLIADGEEQQAKLASQNVDEYTKLIEIHRMLAAKYAKAAQQPWVKVEPDPPMP